MKLHYEALGILVPAGIAWIGFLLLAYTKHYYSNKKHFDIGVAWLCFFIAIGGIALLIKK